MGCRAFLRGSVLWGVVALALALPGLGQVTGRQGSEKDQPNDFHSPMVLDVPFPSDPKTWTGEWFTNNAYREISRFRCDGIRIVELSLKVKKIGDPDQNAFAVRFRTKLLNPDGNHDKEVIVRFDVKQKDRVLQSAEFGPVKVEESDSVKREVGAIVRDHDSKDPPTTFTITVTAWNK